MARKGKMAPAPGEFSAEGYKVAAEEHLKSLSKLYHERMYVLAHYVSGIAVECIFRAYRCRTDPEFDARHDLHELYRSAGIRAVVRSHEAEDYGRALTAVAVRWSNTHRYRSEVSLRRFLRRAGLHRDIKGDFLKENTRRIISAATEVVSLGVLRWRNT